MQTYTFHVSLVCQADRRQRQILSHEQAAPSLNKAFDEAEAHFADSHPKHDASISLSGSVQADPFPVRKPRRFQGTLGDALGLDGLMASMKAA